MPTIEEVRKRQDVQLEYLGKLQADKARAPGERQNLIQKEIDAVLKKIRELSAIVRTLTRSSA
jgi:hypothetical protein